MIIFLVEKETVAKKDQENQWYNMMVAEMEKIGKKHYWSLQPDLVRKRKEGVSFLVDVVPLSQNIMLIQCRAYLVEMKIMGFQNSSLVINLKARL